MLCQVFFAYKLWSDLTLYVSILRHLHYTDINEDKKDTNFIGNLQFCSDELLKISVTKLSQLWDLSLLSLLRELIVNEQAW